MNLKKIKVPSGSLKPRSNILIIYTGGTFGMAHDSEGVLIPFDFSAIVDHLPILKSMAIELTVLSFENPIDSSNVDPSHWQLLANVIFEMYDNHDGFVILHGTDTMAYTASALSFMLEDLTKPVILTGAQLPISEPRSDARENLITALEIASAKKDGHAVVPEVCVYFDYELLRGNRSKKVESMQFDAFASGNYPPLARAGVTIDYNLSVIKNYENKKPKLHSDFDANVAILKLFPGITETIVNSILNADSVKAVVIETFGSGNAPSTRWLIEALRSAVARGTIILNVSQCPGGMVIQGRYETSKELKEAGVVGGLDMTTEAAVAKLMVLLAQHPPAMVKQLLSKSIAGELTQR